MSGERKIEFKCSRQLNHVHLRALPSAAIAIATNNEGSTVSEEESNEPGSFLPLIRIAINAPVISSYHQSLWQPDNSLPFTEIPVPARLSRSFKRSTFSTAVCTRNETHLDKSFANFRLCEKPTDRDRDPLVDVEFLVFHRGEHDMLNMSPMCATCGHAWSSYTIRDSIVRVQRESFQPKASCPAFKSRPRFATRPWNSRAPFIRTGYF